MSNDTQVAGQGRWVKARHGVRLEMNINGCIVFPHRDGKQPGEDETWTYGKGFQVKGKNIMFVPCIEKVGAATVSQPGTKAQTDQGSAPQPVTSPSKPVAQPHKRHQGGQHKGNTAKGGDRRGEQKHGGNKPPVVTRTFKPATAADSVPRARAFVSFDPTAAVEQSGLLTAWAHKRVYGDQPASALRSTMIAVLARINDLQGQQKGPAAILTGLSQGQLELAERIHGLRNKRADLKKQQSALAGERVSALGQRSKRLKAAGDNADPAEVQAVAAMKAQFAERQATLSLAVAANNELLDGGRGEWPSQGLEDKLYCSVAGLLTLTEAKALRDSIMQAVADVFAIHGQTIAAKVELAQHVNDYEKLLG